jgi:hypothetical protein
MFLQRSLDSLINPLKVIVYEWALLPYERHPVVEVAIVNPEVWVGRVSVEVGCVGHDCVLVSQSPDIAMPR